MGQHLSLRLLKVLPKPEESTGYYNLLGDFNNQKDGKGQSIIKPLREHHPNYARKQKNWVRLLLGALLCICLVPKEKLKSNAFELIYGKPITLYLGTGTTQFP